MMVFIQCLILEVLLILKVICERCCFSKCCVNALRVSFCCCCVGPLCVYIFIAVVVVVVIVVFVADVVIVVVIGVVLVRLVILFVIFVVAVV